MSLSEGGVMGVEGVGVAWGHVRNAAAGLLAVEDPSGESLFVFAECLDVEDALAALGAAPVFVEGGLSPVESLVAASEALERVGQPALAAVLDGLAARAGR